MQSTLVDLGGQGGVWKNFVVVPLSASEPPRSPELEFSTEKDIWMLLSWVTFIAYKASETCLDLLPLDSSGMFPTECAFTMLATKKEERTVINTLRLCIPRYFAFSTLKCLLGFLGGRREERMVGVGVGIEMKRENIMEELLIRTYSVTKKVSCGPNFYCQHL